MTQNWRKYVSRHTFALARLTIREYGVKMHINDIAPLIEIAVGYEANVSGKKMRLVSRTPNGEWRVLPEQLTGEILHFLISDPAVTALSSQTGEQKNERTDPPQTYSGYDSPLEILWRALDELAHHLPGVDQHEVGGTNLEEKKATAVILAVEAAKTSTQKAAASGNTDFPDSNSKAPSTSSD